MATFKVFDAEVLPLGEAAVIITTAWLDNESPGGEAFLILPEKDHPLVAHGIAFDAKSFADSSVTLDENFILNEALNQALIDLRIYIADFAQKRQIPLPLSGPAVVEHPWTHLIQLWLRGKHTKALQTIMKDSQAQELSEKLKVATNIPPIKVTTIGSVSK
ncbi:hypothetical protein [Caballeronia concitans]|uniref:Uncharacterized protein n=1 Tax=Caballeronia concitans TaxID=1777133 RepID=A0A658R5Y7_9BURK|nr:hypothetical protein [Caballeronia concitans]SAL52747.1 hypothetical protein AWB72_05632 [Caballeronia concitans]